MFDKVLIANRGAIACRIVRTLKRMGIRSVAVYSEADRHSLHVTAADEAVFLGPSLTAQSYLCAEKLIEAARATGARAIHPGYGFLSESAAFAAGCEAAAIAFVGPTPQQIRDFGLKHHARSLARANGLPLLPGSELLSSPAEGLEVAARIGYPVMLKSTAGGGGIGMKLCRNAAELSAAYASVERLARSHFSDGGLFIEKYIDHARHIEVQLFGDGAGNVIALGERDCSMQRRNQKVVEEAPAPNLPNTIRKRLSEAAVSLGRAVDYRSAGTVEFVYDIQSDEFYFLEVNTRLQVEHGVTEAVMGVDLVEWMIQVAAGVPPPLMERSSEPAGHAIQVRLYAEDPARQFRPSSGPLSQVTLPEGVRVDTWIETGSEVSAFYDPMLAKIIVHGPTRQEALARLDAALAQTRVYGIETNLEYLRATVSSPTFRAGEQFTRFLSEFAFPACSIEVLQPGTQATVQDYPGRVGFWNVGVPPSGPMDDLAFRLANRLVGNPLAAAGLELTGKGPTLQFGVDSVIALTGAAMPAQLDGSPVPHWQPIRVRGGSVLTLGNTQGSGARTYLAVKGGFDVPEYLGSRSTFTLGQFGGHVGRALRAGDVLRLPRAVSDLDGCVGLAPEDIPAYSSHWDIAVTCGPHGAPDFFTQSDIDTFFDTSWEVHYNSSRTGVRLIGPKPQWARADGGEAGLHPSNIHDNAYAIGAIDYTGDMPVILGPDGPSLGGFVCPAVVTPADLWKVGQLRPGDTIRFRPVIRSASPILHRVERSDDRVAVTYRHSGADYLLIEYGPPVLDLELRFRVQALMDSLERLDEPAIIDLTPGIRSLQVHYDSRALSLTKLQRLLLEAEARLPSIDTLEVPSRIVHLPLSWDDPATRVAIERYMQSVRRDAPWCPSNIEFIRRMNGLDSVEDVRRIVFDASYLVMGLGDVYLGAPVATPLDPRHRLVTTKYNPARTWTPENAVGIGGAYLCVYGMEGPGGYQFVGRTVQMWNRLNRPTADFCDGKQWLLRFFDQIRFYPVTAAELLQLREDFPYGRVRLKVQQTTLRLRDCRHFLEDNAVSIAQFKARQQAAFEAERQRWNEAEAAARGEARAATSETRAALDSDLPDIPDGCIAISSPIAGSVWQISVNTGARVSVGDELIVVEAMKMEIPVAADEAGEVVEVRCERGRVISAGGDFIGVAAMLIRDLLADYRARLADPVRVMTRVMDSIATAAPRNAWITLVPRQRVLAMAQALASRPPESLPLYGVPFAIKDNIDLAGVPTTAGCPEYAYTPSESAFVVQRLIDAGAIPVGKTHLDQFATGLVGTRSPQGACQNSFNPAYISGGSSSGSAVTVATGLVSFALGTDTAGSGRVPAAFNNLIGLKPTCGALSSRGVVPACRSLDSVSILALTAEDAERVYSVARGFDPRDSYSVASSPRSTGYFGIKGVRLGVPRRNQLNFFGDAEYSRLFEETLSQIEALGGRCVEIDFQPFLAAARLLYEGPWLAERYCAIGDFLEQHPEAVYPVTRQIIAGSKSVSAADAFRAQYRLMHLRREAEQVWSAADVLVTPTAGTIYTIEAVNADPARLNSNLGYYTNFVNLLNLAAVAAPAGFRRDGIPFGVTFVGRAGSDYELLDLADSLQRARVDRVGALPTQLPAPRAIDSCGSDDRICVAVCGAHMAGLPLNHQLTTRRATFLCRTRTSPVYSLYALPGGPPHRPGLIRAAQGGAGIEVEVWSVPSSEFGSFVNGVAPPLAIGKVELEDGSLVSGFICEAYAAPAARDITSLGGWRAYLETVTM